MKKYGILMMAVLMMISLSVSAQKADMQQRPEGNMHQQREMKVTAKERAENLAKQLSLTAEQTAKVQALYEKQDIVRAEQRKELDKKHDEIKQKQQQNREEFKALMEKEMKAQDAELQGVIGKEKMDKLNTIREERKAKMQERMQNRQGKMGRNHPGLDDGMPPPPHDGMGMQGKFKKDCQSMPNDTVKKNCRKDCKTVMKGKMK